MTWCFLDEDNGIYSSNISAEWVFERLLLRNEWILFCTSVFTDDTLLFSFHHFNCSCSDWVKKSQLNSLRGEASLLFISQPQWDSANDGDRKEWERQLFLNVPSLLLSCMWKGSNYANEYFLTQTPFVMGIWMHRCEQRCLASVPVRSVQHNSCWVGGGTKAWHFCRASINTSTKVSPFSHPARLLRLEPLLLMLTFDLLRTGLCNAGMLTMRVEEEVKSF